ncbi:TIR domain protein [compost metagenome]
MSENRPRAFISHSHADKETAKILAAELAKHGVDPWFDQWEIGPGDSIVEKVFEEGLRNCSVFVILLSANSIKSEWVRHELSIAFINKMQRVTKIVPVMLDNCEIPVALRSLLYLNFNEGIDKVVNGIVDAAYKIPPQKPQVGSPPSRIQRLVAPQNGLSQEATTIAASIAKSLDLTRASLPAVVGPRIHEALELSPEEINDAVDELASRGLVKTLSTMGTYPYNFAQITPTYALVYLFSEHLKEPFNPQSDIREIAAQIASSGSTTGASLSKALSLSPLRVNLAVSYLSDAGLISVQKSLGTAPFSFALATSTRETRQYVKGL